LVTACFFCPKELLLYVFILMLLVPKISKVSILTEKYLAIEEEWFANFLVNQNLLLTNAMKVEEPKVNYVSLNSYSERELGWMGISAKSFEGKMVAIIPVEGVMSRGWSWDGCNTEWIGRQVQIAAENVNVVASVLKMNTPGGSVNVTSELGFIVDKCAKVKPILSHTAFMCASAGLWVDSQTTESWIGTGATIGKGSLGIIATYMSVAKKMEKEGIDVKVLRSKGSENKALLNIYEPLNDAALAQEQKLIDAMRTEFLGAVMKKRPKVSADIGGEMFYGRDVIKAGLADYMGDLDAVVKRALFLAVKG
jgi:protease-4